MTRLEQIEWALSNLLDVLDIHGVAQTGGVDPAVLGAIDRAKGALGGYEDEPEDEEESEEDQDEGS